MEVSEKSLMLLHPFVGVLRSLSVYVGQMGRLTHAMSSPKVENSAIIGL